MDCEFYSAFRFLLFQKGQYIIETSSLFDKVDKFIFLMNDTSAQPFLAKALQSEILWKSDVTVITHSCIIIKFIQ